MVDHTRMKILEIATITTLASWILRRLLRQWPAQQTADESLSDSWLAHGKAIEDVYRDGSTLREQQRLQVQKLREANATMVGTCSTALVSRREVHKLVRESPIVSMSWIKACLTR